MQADQVFSVVNMMAMLMWILLIFVPKWKVTSFLIKYKLIPILLSVVYLIYISISFAGGTAFDFSSLQSVMELFTMQDAVLAGWVHYLAFDLLIGIWIVEQNRSLQLHHLLIVPCLILTFMLGPVGFLLFSLIKSFKNN